MNKDRAVLFPNKKCDRDEPFSDFLNCLDLDTLSPEEVVVQTVVSGAITWAVSFSDRGAPKAEVAVNLGMEYLCGLRLTNF